jgi:hypothetical protein
VVTRSVLFFLLISGISGISVAQDNTGRKNADTDRNLQLAKEAEQRRRAEQQALGLLDERTADAEEETRRNARQNPTDVQTSPSQASATTQRGDPQTQAAQREARQDKIAELQQEINNLESEADNDDSHAADLEASAPSGPLGGIDRIGAIHMRTQARSARNRANSLRSKLAQLDAEAAAATTLEPEPSPESEATTAGGSSSPISGLSSKSGPKPAETYNPNRHYSGPGAGLVNTLLARSPGWSCPSSTAASFTYTPPVEQVCMRDSYIIAAVAEAYGAECEARLGRDKEAAADAKTMMENVSNAKKMCSHALVIGGGGSRCSTLGLVPCP